MVDCKPLSFVSRYRPNTDVPTLMYMYTLIKRVPLTVGSPEPLVSSGEIWGNKGKVPLEHSKNVLYFSSTLSCHIFKIKYINTSIFFLVGHDSRTLEDSSTVEYNADALTAVWFKKKIVRVY